MSGVVVGTFVCNCETLLVELWFHATHDDNASDFVSHEFRGIPQEFCKIRHPCVDHKDGGVVGDLLQFKRFDSNRKALMRSELTRLTNVSGMPDFAVAVLRDLLA